LAAGNVSTTITVKLKDQFSQPLTKLSGSFDKVKKSAVQAGKEAAKESLWGGVNKKLKSVQGETEKTVSSFKQLQKTIQGVGMKMTLAGVGTMVSGMLTFNRAIKKPMESFGEFEQKLTDVQFVMSANADQMKQYKEGFDLRSQTDWINKNADALKDLGYNLDRLKTGKDQLRGLYELNRKYIFTPTEIAQGLYEVASAGIKEKDAMLALEPILAAGIALHQDLGQVAESAISTMRQYGLEVKDLTHITDVWAQMTKKSMWHVNEVLGAFQTTGALAKSMGASLETTAVLLMGVRDMGYSAEQSSQYVENLFRQIQSYQTTRRVAGALDIPMTTTEGYRDILDILSDVDKVIKTADPGKLIGIFKEGAQAFEESGMGEEEPAMTIAARKLSSRLFDLQSQYKGLTASQLKASLSQEEYVLLQKMATVKIFGSVPALKVAGAAWNYYGKQNEFGVETTYKGIEGMKQMRQYMESDAIQGSMRAYAEAQKNTWVGVTKLFKSSIEGLKNAIGSGLGPVLVPVLQKFTDLLNKVVEFAQKNPALMKTIALLVGGVGALMMIAGAATTAAGMVTAFAGTLIGVASSGGALLGILAGIGFGIGMISLAVDKNSVNRLGGAISSVVPQAEGLSNSLADMYDAISKNDQQRQAEIDGLESEKNALLLTIKMHTQWRDQFDKGSPEWNEQQKMIDDFGKALVTYDERLEKSKASAKELAGMSLGEKWKKYADQIKAQWGDLYPVLKDSFLEIWGIVWQKFGEGFGKVIDWISRKFWTTIYQISLKLVNFLTKFGMGGLVKGMAEKLGGMAGKTEEQVRKDLLGEGEGKGKGGGSGAGKEKSTLMGGLKKGWKGMTGEMTGGTKLLAGLVGIPLAVGGLLRMTKHIPGMKFASKTLAKLIPGGEKMVGEKKECVEICPQSLKYMVQQQLKAKQAERLVEHIDKVGFLQAIRHPFESLSKTFPRMFGSGSFMAKIGSGIKKPFTVLGGYFSKTFGPESKLRTWLKNMFAPDGIFGKLRRKSIATEQSAAVKGKLEESLAATAGEAEEAGAATGGEALEATAGVTQEEAELAAALSGEALEASAGAGSGAVAGAGAAAGAGGITSGVTGILGVLGTSVATASLASIAAAVLTAIVAGAAIGLLIDLIIAKIKNMKYLPSEPNPEGGKNPLPEGGKNVPWYSQASMFNLGADQTYYGERARAETEISAFGYGKWKKQKGSPLNQSFDFYRSSMKKTKSDITKLPDWIKKVASGEYMTLTAGSEGDLWQIAHGIGDENIVGWTPWGAVIVKAPQAKKAIYGKGQEKRKEKFTQWGIINAKTQTRGAGTAEENLNLLGVFDEYINESQFNTNILPFIQDGFQKAIEDNTTGELDLSEASGLLASATTDYGIPGYKPKSKDLTEAGAIGGASPTIPPPQQPDMNAFATQMLIDYTSAMSSMSPLFGIVTTMNVVLPIGVSLQSLIPLMRQTARMAGSNLALGVVASVAPIIPLLANLNNLISIDLRSLRGLEGDETYKALSSGTGKGAKAAMTARQQVGKPYVLGTHGPDTFDCSGLVQYAYSSAGLSVPAPSESQSLQVRPVPMGMAGHMLGALVFRKGSMGAGEYPGGFGHVGMVTGMGEVTEAKGRAYGVVRSGMGNWSYAGVVPGALTGGYIKTGGIVNLHPGEVVSTAPEVSATKKAMQTGSSGANIGPISINVHVANADAETARQLAENVIDEIESLWAQRESRKFGDVYSGRL
jgi:hypothetical protein